MDELEFNSKVKIDENGGIECVIVEQIGEAIQCISRYDFYSRIKLDENNNLKIIIE